MNIQANSWSASMVQHTALNSNPNLVDQIMKNKNMLLEMLKQ